jgi:hypothetical protein
MTTPATFPAINPQSFIQLLKMSYEVLDSYTDPEPDEGPSEKVTVVLKDEALLAKMEACILEANAFRAEHPDKAGAAPVADISLVTELAHQLIYSMAYTYTPFNTQISSEYEGGFWEDFLNELFAFFDSGEISDRS